jgi:hypothetical protein
MHNDYHRLNDAMDFQRAAQACIEGIPARVNDSWKPDDSEKVT